MQLTSALIATNLGTSTIPSAVLCLEQVASTMDEARRLAAQGAPEGLLVLAEEQTAGRGRLGRRWVAPTGSGLLLSLLLRPTWLEPPHAFYLTMLAATSLCAAVEDVTSLRPALKWPNDLLLPLQNVKLKIENAENAALHNAQCSMLNAQFAKAAGILVELQLRGNQINQAVVGIGVNVHAAPPAEYTPNYPATSLDAVLQQPVDRLALLRALLRRFDAAYTRLRAGEQGAIYGQWRARLVTLGRQVQVNTGAGVLAGLAEDVTPEGALCLRLSNGSLCSVLSGDVFEPVV